MIGARQHNLKDIDVRIPRDRLVVITGPSGSGKSSLAFDTIYAEGQRRYVESLSAYARQFLGVQDKPDVDDISGLSPAISIEQKGVSHNPRSTVGTVTEIYDHLRLLFGRAGVPYCPKCGRPVRRHTLDQIVDLILDQYEGHRLEILSPLVRGKKGEFKNLFLQLHQKGFLRIRVDGVVYWLEDEIPLDKNQRHSIEVVIDRLQVQKEKRDRLSEGVESALRESEGFVLLLIDGEREELLTENYVCPSCSISLPEVEPRLFSFNSPYGACPSCSGLGSYQYFSADLAVDPERSVLEGALLPWKTSHYMLRRLEALARYKGWNLSPPFRELPKEIQDAILNGTPDRLPMTYRERGEEYSYMGRYEGLLPWLERRFNETESDAIRDELTTYRAEDVCETCKGLRLRQEALSVRIGDYTIGDWVSMPVQALLGHLERMKFPSSDWLIAEQVVKEVKKRLSFMVDVGVGYLTLSRRADTLSGGESQRIRLATQIGSKLSGVLYVLDEPTIGLHPRDTGRLLNTLRSIRDLGNTVIVVEHDRDVMMAADFLVEMGPGAGEMGGKVTAVGTPEEVMENIRSLSGPYLTGESSGVVKPPHGVRKPSGWLKILDASEHNLKHIDLSIPLGVFACVSGVSGSGKSTLMYDVLYRGLRRKLDRNFRERAGAHRDIMGFEGIKKVVLVDQSPIGRTPRSNPATYTGVFTPIREFFAQLPEAKLRGYGPGRFSFNVKGGRCEACRGEGKMRVSMLFMPDVYVTCEVCGGKRYNKETLEVRYKGLSIADVLELTVDEALELFKDIPSIASKMKVIQEAGLGYIRLGQPATTLSGGEAQRVKLSYELSKRFTGSILYLLDEPTTGLHYLDVKKLIILLHKLVDQGNSLLVIEHNLDVLASSDYIIDLGPEGGDEGGYIVAEGTPEEVASGGVGYTAEYLARFFGQLKVAVS